MKRGFLGFVLLMLVLTSFSFASVLAQDSDSTDDSVSEEIDDETAAAVKVMDEPEGRHYRIRQLVHKLLVTNKRMGFVIEHLKERGIDESVISDLEAIFEEIELLIEEAKSIDPENEDAREQFVSIVEESRELIASFKEIAHEQISPEDRVNVRDRFNEADEDSEVKDWEDRADEYKKKYNASRLRNVAQDLLTEEELEEYKQGLEDGTLTLDDVKEKIKEAYDSLSDEEKDELKNEWRNSESKRRVNHVKNVASAKVSRLEKASERTSDRAAKLEEKGFDKASERLEKRSNAFSTRAETVKDDAKKRIGHIKERTKDKEDGGEE